MAAEAPSATVGSGGRATGSARGGGSAAAARATALSKGSRISGPARDKLTADLRKKYEKGQSIRALAESTGRSYGFVHRLLVDASVPLRGRGGATRVKKK